MSEPSRDISATLSASNYPLARAATPMTAGAGWSARLDIEIERRGDASGLGRRQHLGPLRIQRPFYPEGPGFPHVYVLHPPGGVVGGDRLEIDVRVRDGAGALFTTPAAQKLYRSSERASWQSNRLSVAEGGTLEWLPSETIVFDGARATAATRVTLARGARLLAWDILCFGRPASELPFRTGELVTSFEIAREGAPLAIERACVRGGAPVLESAWGYAGAPVFGSFYAVPAEPTGLAEWVTELRAELSDAPARVAITALDDLLVVRAGATTVESLRGVFGRAWQFLRPRVLGRAAVVPRIWHV